ncbi:MAG: hypothetical protein FJ315_05705 [SAR202 cluster bacterium]|nr:hypothetical protein [SAR202 cluster bacterium]
MGTLLHDQRPVRLMVEEEEKADVTDGSQHGPGHFLPRPPSRRLPRRRLHLLRQPDQRIGPFPLGLEQAHVVVGGAEAASLVEPVEDGLLRRQGVLDLVQALLGTAHGVPSPNAMTWGCCRTRPKI